MAGSDARGALHLNVHPIVAGLAFDLAIVFLVLLATAVVNRRRGGPVDRRVGPGFRRRRPARNLPNDSREGFEREATLGPLPAGLAGPVKGAQTGVDGTLVGLGPELVGRKAVPPSLDGSVVTVAMISVLLGRRLSHDG